MNTVKGASSPALRAPSPPLRVEEGWGEEVLIGEATGYLLEMALHSRCARIHAAFGTVVGCDTVAAFAFLAFAVTALSEVPACTMRRAVLYCA